MVGLSRRLYVTNRRSDIVIRAKLIVEESTAEIQFLGRVGGEQASRGTTAMQCPVLEIFDKESVIYCQVVGKIVWDRCSWVNRCVQMDRLSHIWLFRCTDRVICGFFYSINFGSGSVRGKGKRLILF